MDLSAIKNIECWISDNLPKVRETSLVADIHIDELIGADYSKLTKKEVLNFCLSISEKVADIIIKQQLEDDINIFLSVDLISESNKFCGKPNSFDEVEEELDILVPPEFIIYKEQISGTPVNEFYRVPLLFDPFDRNSKILIFYKEYRSLEELENNDDYRRELNIVFAR